MKCSKICSKSFRKPFKLLWTSNALVHKPFVQNADSAVIFINRCPEISILKAFGKVPLLEPEHQQKANFQRQLFAFNQRLRLRPAKPEAEARLHDGLQGAARAKSLSLRKSQSCQRLPWESGGDPWLIRNYFVVEEFSWFSQRKLLMSLNMEVKIRDHPNPGSNVLFGRLKDASRLYFAMQEQLVLENL